jgi:hypothetical protein
MELEPERLFAIEVAAEFDAWQKAQCKKAGSHALKIARLGVARNFIVGALFEPQNKKEMIKSFFSYIEDEQIEIPEDLKNKILLLSL